MPAPALESRVSAWLSGLVDRFGAGRVWVEIVGVSGGHGQCRVLADSPRARWIVTDAISEARDDVAACALPENCTECVWVEWEGS